MLRGKLKERHWELARVLRDLHRWRDAETETASKTKTARGKTQQFLIRLKAVQRTRENMAKRMGVWGTSRRSAASMCVSCEMGTDGKGKGCWRHGMGKVDDGEGAT